MTVVIRHKIRNRLREALLDGGGLRVDEALTRAEDNVRELAGDCEAAIRSAIAAIDAQFGRAAANRDDRSPLELYDRVLGIIDASAALDGDALPKAARSLCDLLDHCADHGWDWPAVDVHINALRLLGCEPDLPPEAATQLLENLDALRRHRGVAGA